MTNLVPLPRILYENTVLSALSEDLGLAGDITTRAVIDPALRAHVALTARQPGTVAGLDVARLAFERLDSGVDFKPLCSDGAKVHPALTLATIEGPAWALLSAERVALNFLGHLCGIATATAQLVDAVSGTRASICCTRKTTPGLRALEKYAVRAGGGANHRFGLNDGILIKDNHIAVAGGITPAVTRARSHGGHMVKIEVEVDTLEQLDEALALGVDAVLLDNMTPAVLAQAVQRIGGRALSEASGRITLETVRAIADAGVDLISAGWITHSAPSLDIGLDEVD